MSRDRADRLVAERERREVDRLAADEVRRLARCRTLLAVASEKVNSVPDSHPQRRELERKLRVVKDRLGAQEREAG
jgi:hypothetical protein